VNHARKLKAVTFQTRDGRPAGRVVVSETGVRSRGNAHYTTRRPDGPVCECGAPWTSICPTAGCAGRSIPLAMARSEKQDAGTRRFPGHPALLAEERRQARAEKDARKAKRRQRDGVDRGQLERLRDRWAA
jgi:hypothetical protein